MYIHKNGPHISKEWCLILREKKGDFSFYQFKYYKTFNTQIFSQIEQTLGSYFHPSLISNCILK